MAKTNEWTVMFFFASDNALSPLIVSHLKAIKDAGFQHDTEVLVHFDPNEMGVPTRILNVNRKRKADHTPGRGESRAHRRTLIGDGADPFVRNMEEDIVELGKISAGRASDAQKEIDVKGALQNFLDLCRKKHRAKHYILFLVGHGMIVGNDAFLPDDTPVSAVTLKELDQEILRPFSEGVRKDGGEFELLALHSCSMSAVEVAYQLKGTANYLMASEGLSFVGSWPYRHLLKKTFNTVESAELAKKEAGSGAKAKSAGQKAAAENSGVDVTELVEKLYYLSLHNATDFISSGYSVDICLCSLAEEKFKGLTVEIQKLVSALKKGLNSERGKELILLAHWEAQSFWQESYTDLYDFCRCLRKRCGQDEELQALGDACFGVMEKLKPNSSAQRPERFKAIVVHADNFGSEYQYAHGLSVYFPWSKPIENVNGNGKDAEKGILANYEDYTFTTDLGKQSWLSFLESYFKTTQRQTRKQEDKEDGIAEDGGIRKGGTDTQALTAALDSFFGTLSNGNKPIPSLSISGGNKPIPSMGIIACDCPSIKNYPKQKEVVEVKGKKKRNVPAFAITDGALDAFKAP